MSKLIGGDFLSQETPFVSPGKIQAPARLNRAGASLRKKTGGTARQRTSRARFQSDRRAKRQAPPRPSRRIRESRRLTETAYNTRPLCRASDRGGRRIVYLEGGIIDHLRCGNKKSRACAIAARASRGVTSDHENESLSHRSYISGARCGLLHPRCRNRFCE
jgi:hypothetical protein